jgi:hypothetical protein
MRGFSFLSKQQTVNGSSSLSVVGGSCPLNQKIDQFISLYQRVGVAAARGGCVRWPPFCPAGLACVATPLK